MRLLRVLRKVEVLQVYMTWIEIMVHVCLHASNVTLQAKGTGLQPEEERWKSKLQQMHRDLNSPTQYKAHVNELASLVRHALLVHRTYISHLTRMLQARIQEDSLAAPELVGAQELDDASLEVQWFFSSSFLFYSPRLTVVISQSVHKFLDEQQRGLFQLTEIIKKDSRDLQALTDTIGKPPGPQPMQQ